MHAFLEAEMNEKPALRPEAAIGPTMRAIAARIIGDARTTLIDPERPSADAVHEFRRSMKQWRALMRLLEPFVPDAVLLRQQARDHARSLARARDGQSALNAFDDLLKKGLVLSERTTNTIRGRIEGIRAGEEQAVLTPELRDVIIAWLDSVMAAIEFVAARSVRIQQDRGAADGGLSQRPARDPGRLVAGEPGRIARVAPARGRSPLSDRLGRAAMAAPQPHVDRRSRAAARPARTLPGP